MSEEPQKNAPRYPRKSTAPLEARVKAKMVGYKRFLSPQQIFLIISLVFVVWALYFIMEFTRDVGIVNPQQTVTQQASPGTPGSPTPVGTASATPTPAVSPASATSPTPLATPSPTPTPTQEELNEIVAAYAVLKNQNLYPNPNPPYNDIIKNPGEFQGATFLLKGRVENFSLRQAVLEEGKPAVTCWQGELTDFRKQVWAFLSPAVPEEMKREKYITMTIAVGGLCIRAGYNDKIPLAVTNGYASYKFVFDKGGFEKAFEKVFDWPRGERAGSDIRLHQNVEPEAFYFLASMLEWMPPEELAKRRDNSLTFKLLMTQNTDLFRAKMMTLRGMVVEVSPLTPVAPNPSGVNYFYNVMLRDRGGNIWALAIIPVNDQFPKLESAIEVNGLFHKVWAYPTRHKDRVQYNHAPLLVAKGFSYYKQDMSGSWLMYIVALIFLGGFLVGIIIMIRVFRKDRKEFDVRRNKIIKATYYGAIPHDTENDGLLSANGESPKTETNPENADVGDTAAPPPSSAIPENAPSETSPELAPSKEESMPTDKDAPPSAPEESPLR